MGLSDEVWNSLITGGKEVTRRRAPCEEKKEREEGDLLAPTQEQEITCETFARRQEGVGKRAAEEETAVRTAPAAPQPARSSAAGPLDPDILEIKDTAIRILGAIGDAWQKDAARPVVESTCRGVKRAMNLFLAPRKPSPLKPFASFSTPGRTAPHTHTGAPRHHEARSRLMALSEKSRSIIAKPHEAAARMIREQDKYRQQVRERLDRKYPQVAAYERMKAAFYNVPPKTNLEASKDVKAAFYNVPPKPNLEASKALDAFQNDPRGVQN